MSYRRLESQTRGSFYPASWPAVLLSLFVGGCASTQQPVPIVDRTTAESAKTVEKAGSASDTTAQRGKAYVVQKGDTLYAIALNHGVSQKDLAEWNNIQDPAALYIGQQLYLSAPADLSQPSLFRLSEPGLQSKAVATPGASPPSEGKQPGNTDKLKTEPKALKLLYSEHALAQLKGLADSHLAATPMVAKVNLAVEKSTETVASPSAAEAKSDNGPEWIWPTKGKLLEGFSETTKGIDIAGKPGQAVTASAAGKVVYSGAGLRGYGKLIIIKHNNIYLSAYAHNNKILVTEGQTVTKGQKIAEMGNTDTGLVKLHFEIRKNGKPVDPLKHLPEVSG